MHLPTSHPFWHVTYHFTFESWGQLTTGILSTHLGNLPCPSTTFEVLPCRKMGCAVIPRAPFSFSLLSYSSLCRAPSPEWPSLKNSSSDPATSGSATSAAPDSDRMGLAPWEPSIGSWLVWELRIGGPIPFVCSWF